jgi:hypothetical protein
MMQNLEPPAMHRSRIHELLQPLGLRPLNRLWAKAEIFLGLTCVFLSMSIQFGPFPLMRPFGSPEQGHLAGLLTCLVLFVFGGYLAMAGHRSHLYQSSNELTAFLVEEIRKQKDRST